MTQDLKFKAPTADGRMLYPGVELPFDAELLGEAQIIAGRRQNRTAILVVGAGATSFSYRTTRRGPRLGWDRHDGPDALPEHLTPEQWADFENSLGFDDDGDPLTHRIYSPVYGPSIEETTTVELGDYVDFPVNVLDPESVVDPDPTFQWEVSAPYLVFGEAYANGLPGVLGHLAERVAKGVQEGLPNVTVYTHDAQTKGVVAGYKRLQYEDHRTYPMKVGRKTSQKLSFLDYRFEIPVPRFIAAHSKAEAIDQFNATIADIIDRIDTTHAVACSHCDGSGVVAARV